MGALLLPGWANVDALLLDDGREPIEKTIDRLVLGHTSSKAYRPRNFKWGPASPRDYSLTKDSGYTTFKPMEWLRYLVDYGIIGLLLVLSVISLAIFIERYMFLRKLGIETYGERKTLELECTSRLTVLATIGGNAPYIGLLGTVLGIMLTFYTIGVEGYVDTTRIMVGLALALKATAIGLLVAIPSITFYNFLLRRVKVILLEWDRANG
jgi:biopolymer transport protein ExbB